MDWIHICSLAALGNFTQVTHMNYFNFFIYFFLKKKIIMIPSSQSCLRIKGDNTHNGHRMFTGNCLFTSQCLEKWGTLFPSYTLIHRCVPSLL